MVILFFFIIYEDHLQCNMAQNLTKLAVVYQRIEERQNLNNSCYQKFDKEGSDLNLLSLFKAKQGQNVPKRD